MLLHLLLTLFFVILSREGVVKADVLQVRFGFWVAMFVVFDH
jgi:hypothetical protein